METKKFSTIPIQVSYEAQVSIPSNPKRVFLLLHGFKQDGEYLFKLLKDSLPDDVAIISPNGPFFVPVEKREGHVMKYAWYFFDQLKKSYFIDYTPATEYIKSILIELDLHRKPITVIGYSQGGYLAPKIAETITAVDTVIGLGCVFRNKMFDVRTSVMIHQINSKTDSVIDFDSAKGEFLKLRERGNLGRFVALDGPSHRLSNEYIFELAQFL